MRSIAQPRPPEQDDLCGLQVATADQTQAEASLKSVTTYYGMQVVTVDPAIFDEKIRDKFYAFYLEEQDGRRLFVIPVGQDPAVSLGALRNLLVNQEVAPV